MTLVYKLTDMGLYTYNDTQWGQGVEHTAPGGGEMCSNRWLHAYRTPELAAFMNPVHAGIQDPVLWACDGDVEADDGTKIGCTRLKTIGTVAMPNPSTLQRVAFGIMCAQMVPNGAEWVAWAEKWLSGVCRSASAAQSASSAAYAASSAAYAASAAHAASSAAYAASSAASSAAYAARSASRSAHYSAASYSAISKCAMRAMAKDWV